MTFVDDDAARESIACELRARGFEVTTHSFASEALAALERCPPDVLVTDLHLPDGSGLSLLEMTQQQGEIATIVVTRRPDVSSAIGALRLSAVDYVVKPLDPDDFASRVSNAAEQVRARRRIFEVRHELDALARMLEAARAKLVAPGPPSERAPPTSDRPESQEPPRSKSDVRALLSPRELEVVDLLVTGKSAKEIAAALFVSPHTVRNHIRSIYAKLDVHGQVELVRKVVG